MPPKRITRSSSQLDPPAHPGAGHSSSPTEPPEDSLCIIPDTQPQHPTGTVGTREDSFAPAAGDQPANKYHARFGSDHSDTSASSDEDTLDPMPKGKKTASKNYHQRQTVDRQASPSRPATATPTVGDLGKVSAPLGPPRDVKSPRAPPATTTTRDTQSATQCGDTTDPYLDHHDVDQTMPPSRKPPNRRNTVRPPALVDAEYTTRTTESSNRPVLTKTTNAPPALPESMSTFSDSENERDSLREPDDHPTMPTSPNPTSYRGETRRPSAPPGQHTRIDAPEDTSSISEGSNSATSKTSRILRAIRHQDNAWTKRFQESEKRWETTEAKMAKTISAHENAQKQLATANKQHLEAAIHLLKKELKIEVQTAVKAAQTQPPPTRAPPVVSGSTNPGTTMIYTDLRAYTLPPAPTTMDQAQPTCLRLPGDTTQPMTNHWTPPPPMSSQEEHNHQHSADQTRRARMTTPKHRTVVQDPRVEVRNAKIATTTDNPPVSRMKPSPTTTTKGTTSTETYDQYNERKMREIPLLLAKLDRSQWKNAVAVWQHQNRCPRHPAVSSLRASPSTDREVIDLLSYSGGDSETPPDDDTLSSDNTSVSSTDTIHTYDPTDRTMRGSIDIGRLPKHTDADPLLAHLPSALRTTVQRIIYGGSGYDGYPIDCWIRDMLPLVPTAGELPKMIRDHLPLPMDAVRLESLRSYAALSDAGTPYPCELVTMWLIPFIHTYLTVAPSLIPNAGEGVFVRTHRSDTNEVIRLLPPVSLVYMGRLSDENAKTGYTMELRKGRYIVPDQTALPITSKINDNLYTNGPGKALTNVNCPNNYTGELRITKPIKGGAELSMPYGQYNWYSTHEALFLRLAHELSDIATIHPEWKNDYGGEQWSTHTLAIVLAVIRGNEALTEILAELNEETAREALVGLDNGTIPHWSLYVDDFLILWSVARGYYKSPRDAMQVWPHNLLQVARFSSHFTLGLAQHPTYTKYNQDEFIVVFETYLIDRDNFHQLQSKLSYVNSPYLARLQAQMHEKNPDSEWRKAPTRWMKDDFPNESRATRHAKPKVWQPESIEDDDSTEIDNASVEPANPAPAKRTTSIDKDLFWQAVTTTVRSGSLPGQLPESLPNPLPLPSHTVPTTRLTNTPHRPAPTNTPASREVCTAVQEEEPPRTLTRLEQEAEKQLQKRLDQAIHDGDERATARLIKTLAKLHSTGIWETVEHHHTHRTSVEESQSNALVIAPNRKLEKTKHSYRALMEDSSDSEDDVPAPSAPLRVAATATLAVEPPPSTPPKTRNRNGRSPSALSVSQYKPSSTRSAGASRTAQEREEQTDADSSYIEGIEVEWNYYPDPETKGKPKTDLLPRKQNIPVFNNDDKYTVVDWITMWTTAAISGNEHPADLARVLIANPGSVGPRIGEQLRVWAQQYGTGSTVTTAFQPAQRNNIEDSWRWLRAVVVFLCRKYRVMYTSTQVINEMMRLRMPTPNIEGLSALWGEVMIWYRRLNDTAKEDCQLKQIMIKAIMESASPTNEIAVSDFTSTYKSVLKERGREIDQREAIEITIAEMETEFKGRFKRDKNPPLTKAKVNESRINNDYYDDDDYDNDDYDYPYDEGVEQAPLCRQTTMPPQPSRQSGQPNQNTVRFDSNSRYPRNSSGATPPTTNRPAEPSQTTDSLEAHRHLTGPRLGAPQDGRLDNRPRNPNHPDGSRGCAICGSKDHLLISCPYKELRESRDRPGHPRPMLSLTKLATLPVKEGMAIFEQARRYGNLSRIPIEHYDSMKKRLIQLQDEFAKKEGSTKTFKPGTADQQEYIRINTIRIISNLAPLMQFGQIPSGVIFQTNPNDPSPADLDLLMKHDPISNEPLSYFDMKLRRLQKRDADFMEYATRAVPMLNVEDDNIYEAATSMKDSGSATTLCNENLVRRINAHVIDCEHTPLEGLGSGMAAQMAVFVAVIEGTTRRGLKQRWKLLIHALIVPRLSSELLLGGDFIKKHRISCDPDKREAVFFRGEEKIVVPWVPWVEVEAQLRKEQRQKRVRDQEADCRKRTRGTDTMTCTVSVPTTTATGDNNGTVPNNEPQPGSSAPTESLLGAMDYIHATKETSPPLLQVEDYHHVANETPLVVPVTEQEEYRQFRADNCRQELPHLRPPLFPLELWSLVTDHQKLGDHSNPSVQQRWSQYPEKRLIQCIPIIYAIKICEDTPDRREQRDMIRAQAFANIDALCHVDEMNPPCTPNYEANIELIPGSLPYVCKLRRKQPLERACEMMRIKKMLRTGKMEQSKSDWNNPTLLVPNLERIKAFLVKHGANAAKAMLDETNAEEIIALYRPTMDFRELNRRTRLERFPLPRIIDLLDKCVKSSNRYSGGDIADAYFCIPLRQSAREYTAFSTADTHVQYCVLPQGLHSAPAIFSRIVTDMFMGMKSQYLLNYFDDVINTARDFGEHFNLWQKIYDVLRANKLTFKPSKTTLNFHSQKILGHVMTEEGRAIDPEIIRAVMRWDRPRTLGDVQSMIGTAKVAVPYIDNLAALLAPLHELNRKNIDIDAVWRDDYHGQAVTDLKRTLTTPPVLIIPDNTRVFRVHVDACQTGRGLGAVLLQINPNKSDDGEEHWSPCCYWSRALTQSERNLSSVELECTALHDSIIHWHQYLYNTIKPFEVIVDCYALVYLVCKMGNSVHSHQRLTRLCLDLQGYFFNVNHRKGVDHVDADALSRLLQQDEVPYVRDETQLREDTGPLTEDDIADCKRRYTQDADLIIRTINKYRQDKMETLQAISNQATLRLKGTTVAEHPTEETPDSYCGDCHLNLGANVCIQGCTPAINMNQGRIRFNGNLNVKALEKQLSRHVKWTEIHYAILRYRLLATIATKGICHHDIPMKDHDEVNNVFCAEMQCNCREEALKDHDLLVPNCRRTIRSIRSTTLHELFKLREVLCLQDNVILRITEEISRRAFFETMNINSQSHIEKLTANAKQRRREERRANLQLARMKTRTKLPRKPWRTEWEDHRRRERQRRRSDKTRRHQEQETQYWERPLKLVSYMGTMSTPIITRVSTTRNTDIKTPSTHKSTIECIDVAATVENTEWVPVVIIYINNYLY